VYTLRFFLSSKCSLFHNSNVFGSCIIHILYTGCAKIKKITPVPKWGEKKATGKCTYNIIERSLNHCSRRKATARFSVLRPAKRHYQRHSRTLPALFLLFFPQTLSPRTLNKMSPLNLSLNASCCLCWATKFFVIIKYCQIFM